jgi:AAA family ATP:ADP antiporter
MRGLLDLLLPVRRGERRTVALLYGLLALMVAADWVGKVGADSLFVKRVGVQLLPVMYILTPIVMLGASGLLFGLVDRLSPRRLFFSYVAVTTVLSFATQVAVGLGGPNYWWAYIFAHVVKETIYLVFWVYAGNLFDSEQSKRIFPLFAGALLVGKIGGGVAAGALQPLVHPQNFMAIQALGFTAVLIGLALFRRGLPEAEASTTKASQGGGLGGALRDLRTGYRTVSADRLLRPFGVGIFLWYFLMQLANYLYIAGLDSATTSSGLQGAEDSFALLYASVYTSGSIIALLIQTLFTGSVLRRFGVSAVLFVFPLWYFATFGAAWTALTLVTAILLQAGERIIVPAIHLPATQIVFSQIAAELRPRARAFFSGGVNAMGNIGAALVLLAGVTVADPRGVLLFGTVCSAGFVGNTVLVRRALGRRIAENLRSEHPELRRNAAQLLHGDAGSVPTDQLRTVLGDASADIEAGVRLALTRRGALAAAVEANAE